MPETDDYIWCCNKCGRCGDVAAVDQRQADDLANEDHDDHEQRGLCSYVVLAKAASEYCSTVQHVYQVGVVKPEPVCEPPVKCDRTAVKPFGHRRRLLDLHLSFDPDARSLGL